MVTLAPKPSAGLGEEKRSFYPPHPPPHIVLISTATRGTGGHC